jgi:predicted MarR family transcription regulator
MVSKWQSAENSGYSSTTRRFRHHHDRPRALMTMPMESSTGVKGTLPSTPAGSSDVPDRYMSADSMAAALTRIEMSLMRLYGAFSSWALELQKYVSGKQMSFQEVALLHCVRLRGGTTTLAEMMIFLHRHDLAAINYSLRKLEQHGFIRRLKTAYRREVAYALTSTGRAVTDEYGRIRQQSLVHLCRDVRGFEASTNEASAVIERLIGIYDQATQSILNQHLIASSTSSERPEIPEEPPPTKRARRSARTARRR